MKRWFGAFLLVFTAAAGSLAAAKGPEIDLVDNKLSVTVEAISLGRLLRLLDFATGMKSKVPPELANRNMSVRFTGLSLRDGVRKIFQGLPLDYVVIEGQGIVVTAASQTLSASDTVPVYNTPNSQPFEQPFIQDFNPPMPVAAQPSQQQQPAMIQTPFGAIANPNARPAPNAPLSSPGQQNPASLFPGQQAQPGIQPSFPGAQPNNPTPFGAPSPFGAPATTPNNPSGLFGSPAVFGSPGTQQPRTP